MKKEKVKIGNLLSKIADFWRRHPDLNRGIADLQSAALPLGYGAGYIKQLRAQIKTPATEFFNGAGNEARTRYLHLGKVALYRMSYARIGPTAKAVGWCLRSELNQRHADFQSAALPTELQRHIEIRCGGNNWTRTSDPLLVRQVL